HDKCVFQELHTSQLNVEQLDRLKAAIQGSLQLLSELFSISNGDKPLSWDFTEVRIHGSTMLHALFEEEYSDLDYIARVHPTANKIKETLRLLANRCAEREINHKITHITDQEHEWGILQITNVGQRSIDIQFCYIYEQPFCVLDGGGIDITPWLYNTAGNPTWVSNFYTYEEFINCWNRRLVTAFPPTRGEVSEKDFALYVFKTKRGVFRLGTHTSVKGRVTDRAKYKLQLWHKYLGENIRKKLPKAFFRSVELNLSNHCHTDEAKRNYLFFFCYGLPDDVPLEELSSLWPKTGIDALDAPWDSKINHKERRLLLDVMALLCYFPEAFSSSPYRSRPHLEQQGDEQVYLLEIGQALRPLKLRLPVDPLPILTSVCISFSGEKRQINPFIHTLTGIKDAHKIATLTLSTLKPVLQNRLANTTRFLSPLTHSENSHQANNEALKTLHHCFHDFFQTLVFLPEEKEKSTRWFDQFFISSRELHKLSSDQCDSYLINTLKIIYDSTKHPDQIDPLIDRLLSLPPPLYRLLRPLESLRRKKTSVKNFRPYHILRSLTALQLANSLSVKARNSWMKKKLLALSTSLEKGIGDEEVRAAVQRVPELHHLLVDQKMP
ncbi:MAG: hypothetical protein KDK40_04945, partial [Chlamydiia bacterium]|nr:hypothetical protein [Chlamydiia bacterium]